MSKNDRAAFNRNGLIICRHYKCSRRETFTRPFNGDGKCADGGRGRNGERIQFGETGRDCDSGCRVAGDPNSAADGWPPRTFQSENSARSKMSPPQPGAVMVIILRLNSWVEKKGSIRQFRIAASAAGHIQPEAPSGRES